jgi:hypothetical protein
LRKYSYHNFRMHYSVTQTMSSKVSVDHSIHVVAFLSADLDIEHDEKIYRNIFKTIARPS